MEHCSDANASCRSQPQADAGAAAKRRLPLKRLLLLAAVLVGATCAVHFSPLRIWLQDGERVRQALRSAGPWIYPIWVLAVAILVSCGVPRLVFCAIGGMALGFWWGLLLTQTGTLLGYYSTFLLIRWGGHDWVLHRWPKWQRWADLMQEQGVMGVLLVRQLPIHGTLTNLCLGLSRVKQRHFLIGTAIGLFPEAIPTTLVGAGLVKTSLKDSASYLAIAAVALAAIWIICSYAMRVMRDSASGSKLMTEAASLKGVSD